MSDFVVEFSVLNSQTSNPDDEDTSSISSSDSWHSCQDRPARPSQPPQGIIPCAEVTVSTPGIRSPPVCVVAPVVHGEQYRMLIDEPVAMPNPFFNWHTVRFCFDWFWGSLSNQQRAKLAAVFLITTLAVRGLAELF